jgi:hypothetical protein
VVVDAVIDLIAFPVSAGLYDTVYFQSEFERRLEMQERGSLNRASEMGSCPRSLTV